MHNSDMEKWISALNTEDLYEDEADSCSCKKYECETCFPLNEAEIDYYLDDSPLDSTEEPELGAEDEIEGSSDASEDVSELIAHIIYAQDIGMSNNPRNYSEEMLMKMSDSAVQRIYQSVVGDLQETSAGGVAMGGEYEKTNGDEGIYEDEEVYRSNGYSSRKDYLDTLADDNNMPIDVVMSLAELLGPNEDFDGLVTALQDYSEVFNEENDYVQERPNSGIEIIPNIRKDKANKFLSVLNKAFPEGHFVYDPQSAAITAKGDNLERVSSFVDKIRVAVGEGLEEAKDKHDDQTMDMFPEEDSFDFVIGTEFANAIQNGDLSGLSSQDEEQLERFLSELPEGGTWEFDLDNVSYGEEDQVTGQFVDMAVPAKYHTSIGEEGVQASDTSPDVDIGRIKHLSGL